MGGALSGNTVSLDPRVSESRGQAQGREKSFLCVRCFPACLGQVAALAGDPGRAAQRSAGKPAQRLCTGESAC